MARPQAARSIARLAVSVAPRWGLGLVLVSLTLVLAQTFVFYRLPQPFTPFALCAIAITFWYGGTKPGFFTAWISWLVSDYFFEPDVSAESRLLYGLVFLVFALVMTLLMRERNEHEARAAREGIGESEHELRQKKAEEQPGSAAQLQATLNVIPAYAWYANPSGGLTFVNKRTADYLGLPKDHPLRFGIDIGIPWDAHIRFLHPDDQEGSRKAWPINMRTGEASEYSFRVRNAQGGYRWFLSRVESLRASDGTLLQWVGVNLDVEELKRTEQALRESEAKFRDYAETASDWFWEIGPDYKFTLLTENAFGSDSADRIGTACWEHALDLETEPEKWRLVRATLDSRQPIRDLVYCSKGRNGAPMYVRASGKPVFDADGEFRGYRGTGADVTAVVRAQEEHERLRELESQLAHMNRVSVMGELAASLMHEIAQPIAAARNNSRAAMNFLDRNPPDLGEVGEALACLVADTDRAVKIIDGVRGHIKKAPPRKDRFDLNDAIKDVIALARAAIIKNGVTVRTRLAEGPLIVEGDCVQLQQVALNLILNAIEAMSSVKTGARDLLISTEQSRPNEALVAVRDSGPGIDPKDLEHVFETFYTTKSSGTGMGLSISRSIVAAHGGRLWADANAPRGAAFQFTLASVAKDARMLIGRSAGPERRANAMQQTRLVNGRETAGLPNEAKANPSKSLIGSNSHA
jgi:PAS domain S-box-containing protein